MNAASKHEAISVNKRESWWGQVHKPQFNVPTPPNLPLYLASKLSTPRVKGEGLVLHPRLV
ncbi:hypothetical protein THF5H11_10588 [Vibrio jasicida]|nr:hypothetical protein THF5H11_10588 [Vibrio jasicida]